MVGRISLATLALLLSASEVKSTSLLESFNSFASPSQNVFIQLGSDSEEGAEVKAQVDTDAAPKDKAAPKTELAESMDKKELKKTLSQSASELKKVPEGPQDKKLAEEKKLDRSEYDENVASALSLAEKADSAVDKTIDTEDYN